MNIADICSQDVVSIDAQASLREAAALMRSQHVGALVVSEAGPQGGGQHVVGVLSDRDLAIEVLARGGEASEIRVGMVASHKLVGVPAQAGVAEAVELMRGAGVRRLLVVNADGSLAGIVSSDDLLEALSAQLGGLAQALRSGLERERRERSALTRPSVRPMFLNAGTPGLPWTGSVVAPHAPPAA
ncbi:CBS domain-containing protein [Azohydromonas australica]|uniref:CBS domain-containing protein n=1 Tax=Azohydromonas australica TaxID=364039 RepID=UPI00040BAEE2|nr:CBS domain-containing protein [Azohydromonas australica]